jgi:hypothetical protein
MCEGADVPMREIFAIIDRLRNPVQMIEYVKALFFTSSR